MNRSNICIVFFSHHISYAGWTFFFFFYIIIALSLLILQTPTERCDSIRNRLTVCLIHIDWKLSAGKINKHMGVCYTESRCSLDKDVSFFLSLSLSRLSLSHSLFRVISIWSYLCVCHLKIYLSSFDCIDSFRYIFLLVKSEMQVHSAIGDW